MTRKSLLVLVLPCLAFAAMCSDDDDDDNDDNNNDSDDIDSYEGPDCTGYNYPVCDTEDDVPPHLLSLQIYVNENIKSQPLTVQPTDELLLAIEFLIPGDHNELCDGHLFLVKNGEAHCLDAITGLTDYSAFPIGISGICSTEEAGEPFTLKLDPSNFLNGEGTPYYLEILNACATHSNRLPLEIVTKEE